MKRKALIAAAITMALALAGSAQAAPIRECGHGPYGSAVVNITSRNVPCGSARHDALVIARDVDHVNRCAPEGTARNCAVRWAGWTITVRYINGPGGRVPDVRSIASHGRVVRFQEFYE